MFMQKIYIYISLNYQIIMDLLHLLEYEVEDITNFICLSVYLITMGILFFLIHLWRMKKWAKGPKEGNGNG